MANLSQPYHLRAIIDIYAVRTIRLIPAFALFAYDLSCFRTRQT